MSDEMSAEPVAWIVKLPKERRGINNDVCIYYKDGEMLQGHRDAGDEIIPLYAQSPAQARAMAIAEAAKVAKERTHKAFATDDAFMEGRYDAASEIEAAIRALSSPSVSEESAAAFTEWLCREMPPGTIIGDPKWWAPKIYRKALAALGVTVEGAAK